MTLNQALAVIREGRRSGPVHAHFLVCGCQPLHLATFLHAHLLNRLPDKPVEILTGLYGDFAGNLTKAAESPALASAVVLEWGDVDARLGLRGAGGWSNRSLDDVTAACPGQFARFAIAIRELGTRMPVAMIPPTLPLPPIGNTIRAQASGIELDLESQLAAFLMEVGEMPGVRVVQRPRLDGPARLDAKMELLAGFPYTVSFADAIAAALVDVLYQKPPKKGLITDLDDTLWAGLVGEVGPEAVAWQQDAHAQVHGLYQQMLGQLADCGVLIGVCSKNELSVVEAALARADLFLDAEALFPVYADWGPKSASVGQILRDWNIGEDGVVFIDDSPLELAEVQDAFPGVTCLRFPGKDPAKVWDLLGDLRDLFGKPLVLEEDRLRRKSLRAAAGLRESGAPVGGAEFLRGLQGAISVDFRKNAADKRPLELINKTNQFNLNGVRVSEGEWRRLLEAPETIVAVISYRDKFGPLGKTAVLIAEGAGKCVRVSHWVMSCRAFSRGIEMHTLDLLFRHTGAEAIKFAYRETERNQPLREFFRNIGVNGDRIERDRFLARCGGELPHEITETLA